MKDMAIKRRPAEAAAIRDSGARCFSLPNANIKADAMAERFITNLGRITRAAAHAGPFLYTVQAERLQLVPLSAD